MALDVRSEIVLEGRKSDLPIYFGDAGSQQVLKSIGADRASCAVVTLDTPGANYRCVWSLKKNFPNLKIYVRARDIAHGLNLEKAGASAVVPETLEPSLQLAAAVLEQMDMPSDDVASVIDSYRRRHISELKELAALSGSSLGYGMTPESLSSMEEIALSMDADEQNGQLAPSGGGGADVKGKYKKVSTLDGAEAVP